jgi:signal transduction histidine kinase
MGDMEIGPLVALASAGWPLGIALAAALGGDRVVQARRRAALNRAMHELRRPLHGLVLSSTGVPGPGSHSIRVALAALDDLDREINGGPRRFAARPVVGRALVQPAVERWRGSAASARRSLVLRWRAGDAMVMADPTRLAQALDNMIDNALRHGGLRVCVEATLGAGALRISVTDSGGGAAPASSGDPRHGHGLRIVSTVAAEHGGRFEIALSPSGTTAVLELRLAPTPLPVAKRGLRQVIDVPNRPRGPAVALAPQPGGSTSPHAGGECVSGPAPARAVGRRMV